VRAGRSDDGRSVRAKRSLRSRHGRRTRRCARCGRRSRGGLRRTDARSCHEPDGHRRRDGRCCARDGRRTTGGRCHVPGGPRRRDARCCCRGRDGRRRTDGQSCRGRDGHRRTDGRCHGQDGHRRTDARCCCHGQDGHRTRDGRCHGPDGHRMRDARSCHGQDGRRRTGALRGVRRPAFRAAPSWGGGRGASTIGVAAAERLAVTGRGCATVVAVGGIPALLSSACTCLGRTAATVTRSLARTLRGGVAAIALGSRFVVFRHSSFRVMNQCMRMQCSYKCAAHY
jgi:hypothetical protein